MALAHLVWTILLFAIFIAIVAWAWSGRRRQRFEAAARAPLEDDTSPRDNKHE